MTRNSPSIRSFNTVPNVGMKVVPSDIALPPANTETTLNSYTYEKLDEAYVGRTLRLVNGLRKIAAYENEGAGVAAESGDVITERAKALFDQMDDHPDH